MLAAVGGARVGAGGKVGRGVKVIVAVGGIGVAVEVGIAACVNVTAIHASATAVPRNSSTVNVGVGAGPQADIMAIMSVERMVKYFFFILFSVTSFLPQRDTKVLTAKYAKHTKKQ